MAYTPIGWLNNQAPAINQTNLNKMDNEIKRLGDYGFQGTATSLPNNTDLNTILLTNVYYMLFNGRTYYNIPSGLTSGHLFVYRTSGITLQIVWDITFTKLYYRIYNNGWTSWGVGYDSANVTNNSNNIEGLAVALKSIYLDVFYGHYIYPNSSYKGVNYNWDSDKKAVHIVRTASDTANSFCNLSDRIDVVPGETYYVTFEQQSGNVRVYFYGEKTDSTISQLHSTKEKNSSFTIPSGFKRMYYRVDVAPSVTEIDDYVNVFVSRNEITYDILKEIAFIGKTNYLPSCDLNDVLKQNSFYLLVDSQTYENVPYGRAGFLMVYTSTNWTLQIYVRLDTSKMYIRRANASGVWNEWTEIGGGGGITNNYTFNEYSNSYSVTATPTITADTNNYLASTGDTTDRTNDIITMLTQNGVCRLGPGDFYVNGVDMPDNSTIIGSGSKTRVILSGSGDGYCVKMGKYCQISDLAMYGSLNSITLSSTVGGRHGLLWQGNYTQTQSSSSQPMMGIVNNVRFFNFTGGGITCYDTGFGTFNAIEVCNAYMWGCNAGINISYWSEFHKFTNVRTPSCYYGCINNGGNNTFVNCDFSTCKLAFLMDNSQSQSPNNSHGSAIGCVFNHTDSNNGIGIKILNCDNGYVFSGCQIFFSQIDIEDSDGVVISDCNFGSTNTNITIKNGCAVLFANNMHQGQPTISITNNNNVHFANCYVRSTGEAVGQ